MLSRRTSCGTLPRLLSGLVACGALLLTRGASAEPVRYQEIELDWPTPADVEVIRTLPSLELMGLTKDVSARYLSTPELTAKLEQAGLHPRVLHDDLHAFYAARASAQQSRGGTFGDFHSYAETIAELDAIHAAYPSITTAKFSVGTSIEGRTLWAMKFSDNPDVNENEPEVLFDGLHHAREPITVSVLLYYMNWLGANYGTDPDATFLVDNREQWFVPIVNPDGYLYNESTDPAGGGLWRKNRRDVAGSCDGVDLNRNYSYQFGGDGSSADPCEEVYRGTAAFSEPETQAMRNLMRTHAFVTHNSYHSVVGLILSPWAYTTTPPPDNAKFLTMINAMSRDNGYGGGPAGQVLYLAAGAAFDYSYGNVLEKPRAFAFTTEVSGSGFWPLDSEIPGLVAENLFSNIYLARAAGGFVALTAATVTGGDGNGRLDPGETANLVIDVVNTGVVASAQNVTATLASSDGYVQLADASSTIGTLLAGATGSNGSNPFVLTIDPSAPNGHFADFQIHLAWSDGANEETTTLAIGPLPIVVSDNFETVAPGWGIDASDDAASGQWVRVDPNPTPYQPGDDTTPAPGVNCWVTGQNTSTGNFDVDNGIAALRSAEFDLSGRTHVGASLNYFFGQRDDGDDATGDFFRIDLSNDGGATFPANVLLLGDVARGPEWVPLAFDVEDYLSLSSHMVFRFQAADQDAPSDIIEGGIDDLVLIDRGTGNEPPGPPTVSSPEGGELVPGDVTLVVANASDPEGDTLTYGFRVYADALLTSVVRAADGLTEGSLTTSWQVSPTLPDGVYYWRAFAQDAEHRGSFASAASFQVTGSVGVGTPAAPVIALSAPRPNPSSSGSTVHLSLGAPTQVRAEVFAASGRHVRTLFTGALGEGFHELAWDGLDKMGRPASPGEYFVLVRVNGQALSRKAIVVP